MDDSILEQNLLTGMLAVEAELITEDQFLSCFQKWQNDRSQSLTDLLLQNGYLDSGRVVELERLVAEHRDNNIADPHSVLTARQSLTLSLQELVDDSDLLEQLKHIATISSEKVAQRTDQPAGDSEDQPSIAGYKLLSKLGQGGMGSVFVAEQESPVRRRVALKVIRKGMDSAQILARFEAERQALALMDHHNIAKVFDTGETNDGRPYFAMELVKGIPITQYCNQNRLALPDRLNLFVDVCHAIQHAHQKGIIHRDVKPSNVLVTLHDDRPVPKVIDFGLVKALELNLTDRTVYTQFGQVVGTLEYMSPEQAEMNALNIDTRTDIYSLGVVLYELLTGSTPLQRETVKEHPLDKVLAMIRTDEPPRPSVRLSQLGDSLGSVSDQRSTHPNRLSQSVRGDLDWIVMKALEKDRTRRYETANGLANDVMRYLNDEPVMATPPSARYRFRKFARRNKKLLAGGVTVAVVLLVATIVSTAFATWALRERSEAQVSAGKFKAINDFIIGDLLAAARPEGQGLGVDVTLKEALDHAADKIQTAFQDQPEIEAAVRMTLGKSYLELGAFDDSEIHLLESLRLRRLLYGDNHELTVRSLLSYGQLLFSQGKFAEAETCYQKIHMGFAHVYGPLHAQTLDAKRAIARALSEQARFREAIPILRETIDQCLNALGPDDETTLNTRNELAFTLRDLGEFDESEELFRVNLAKRRERDGDRHPETLIALNNLAGLLDEMKKLDEAERLFVECLELRKEVFGPEHPKTVTVMNNLAVLYNRKGELEKAESLMRQVIELQKKLRGNEHAYTLRSTLTLARILRRREKFVEAETISRDIMKTQERVLGPRHRDVLVNKHNLGEILRGQKKLDAAEQMHRDALDIRRQDQVRWQDVAVSLMGLGRTLLENDRAAEAEPLLRESLELYRKDLPRSKAEFAENAGDLGSCLIQLGEFEDAEKILLESHDAFKDDANISAELKTKIRDQIAALYDAWEKPQQAERWRLQGDGD